MLAWVLVGACDPMFFPCPIRAVQAKHNQQMAKLQSRMRAKLALLTLKGKPKAFLARAWFDPRFIGGACANRPAICTCQGARLSPRHPSFLFPHFPPPFFSPSVSLIRLSVCFGRDSPSDIRLWRARRIAKVSPQGYISRC